MGCGDPPISYGRDECPVCKMIVDYEPSSAAMLVEEFGRQRWYFFDDLGCAAVWYKVVKGRGGRVLAVCARDCVDGQWIDLRSAAVLITDEFTSMNTGFLAAKPENVEAYRRGEVRWGPRPGKLIKTVSGSCLLEQFRYGEAWSVPPAGMRAVSLITALAAALTYALVINTNNVVVSPTLEGVHGPRGVGRWSCGV